MKQVAIDYEIDVSQFIVNIHYLKKKIYTIKLRDKLIETLPDST